MLFYHASFLIPAVIAQIFTIAIEIPIKEEIEIHQ